MTKDTLVNLCPGPFAKMRLVQEKLWNVALDCSNEMVFLPGR